MPIVSHKDCAEKYSRYDGEAHLCAGQGDSSGSGSCQGDSGGPLVCEEGNKWFMHGVVSFGKQGCPTKYYSVFARVTTYLQWITDRIGREIWSKHSLSANVPKFPAKRY